MVKNEGKIVIKFDPGQCVATPAAMEVLSVQYALPEDLLNRHVNGDFGDLSEEDRQRNNMAIRDGSRIFSAYVLNGEEKVWIVTEAVNDIGIREYTTIMLPEEY